MKTPRILNLLLAGTFALTAAFSFGGASAAIPCNELDVIEPDPNMVIPMIYIELPVTLEAALSRGMVADRTDATVAENGAAYNAAENQFRCLGYGQDDVFAGNSTPEQRVSMFAVPQLTSETGYISNEYLFVERLGKPLLLNDGRYLVDFGVITDNGQYLIGELVFVEVDGELYLDGSAIHETVQLNEESITIEISQRFTREVKRVAVTEGDLVHFENLEEDASAKIFITSSDGETVFEGSAMGNMLVGGEDRDQFVVHNLEPGEYTVTIRFDGDGVTYRITLDVSGASDATPVASPVS